MKELDYLEEDRIKRETEEIKRKWIDFSIREDEELEKKELLRKLQEEFNERRNKRTHNLRYKDSNSSVKLR